MIAAGELISPQYRELQKQLHAEPRGYGGRGDKWAGIVLQIAREYDCWSILDYGCGEGSLMKALRAQPLQGMRLDEYDPAIPGKDSRPNFADMVNVTDVLEHIEPDRLDAVLQHIRDLARKVIWMVVSTKESNKVLADGRNAHLIIQPAHWWKHRFRQAGFTLRSAPTVVRTIPRKEWAVILLP
jgi:hypothetical protein